MKNIFLSFLMALPLSSAFSREIDCEIEKEIFKGKVSIVLDKIALEHKQFTRTSDGKPQFNDTFVGLDGQIYGEQESNGAVNFLQYRLRYSADNRLYLDFAPVQGHLNTEFVCLGADLLSFELRDDFDFDQQRESIFSLINMVVKARIPISKNKAGFENSYAEVGARSGFGTLGRDIQWGSTIITGDQYSNTTNAYFAWNLKYGQNINSKSNIEVGLTGTHRRVGFDFYTRPEDKARFTEDYNQETILKNQRDDERAAWEQAKYEWEIQNGYATSIDHQRYIDMSGASAKPEAFRRTAKYYNYGQTMKRETFLLRPEVSYKYTFNDGRSLRVYANAMFVVKDTLKGSKADGVRRRDQYSSALAPSDFVNTDLRSTVNMNNVTLGLVFTFGQPRK